jgi:hypothetical protein
MLLWFEAEQERGHRDIVAKAVAAEIQCFG